MKLSSSIIINAPVPKVFEVFTDLGKAQDRISAIKKLEILEGPEKLAVGTKWEETRHVFGKDETQTMWISEFTENKSYSFDAESHGTKYRSTITFKEVDGGTEVTWSFEGIPQTLFSKIMSLLTFMFAGSMRKLMDADLQDMKKACEA